MTTFKEIRGTAIESVSTDPSNPEVGQIWYNNTIGVLKGYALVAAAWSAGGNMGTLRNRLAGAGIQTSALGFGGYILDQELLPLQKNTMDLLGQVVEIWLQLGLL
jgi:hypothetical protein